MQDWTRNAIGIYQDSVSGASGLSGGSKVKLETVFVIGHALHRILQSISNEIAVFYVRNQSFGRKLQNCEILCNVLINRHDDDGIN